jgi:hypothetical protein
MMKTERRLFVWRTISAVSFHKPQADCTCAGVGHHESFVPTMESWEVLSSCGVLHLHPSPL